jgi:D-cysteine desulfhydrase
MKKKILFSLFVMNGLPVIAQTTLPLFKAFPQFKNCFNYISLANLPTPVRKLEKISMLAQADVFMKFDGLTAHDKTPKLYGGNKVRKLEFLLADARAQGAQSVMTFGAAGSNHCLATAAYAHELGLECDIFLKPQPSEAVVRRNLLLQLATGSHLHYFLTEELRNNAASFRELNQEKITGKAPYVIPTGGSNSIGILGFVNAAFELDEQIKQDILPEPDYIFVPLGSGGSYCGLTLACKVLGLKTIVVGVPIEPINFEPPIREALGNLNQMLHKADHSFPLYDWQKEPLSITTGYAGEEYGLFTEEDNRAMRMLKELENIDLDGVYTGKACACMLDYLSEQNCQGKTFLFWNTFCSVDFSKQLQGIDYHELPKGLHTYFE